MEQTTPDVRSQT